MSLTIAHAFRRIKLLPHKHPVFRISPAPLSRIHTLLYLIKAQQQKLRGFGPLANYADRATAACWRSSANFCG
jgi:hypothetical protein